MEYFGENITSQSGKSFDINFGLFVVICNSYCLVATDSWLSLATRLAVDHVLREGEREFNDPKQGLHGVLEPLDTGSEGDEEHVDPCADESYWPGEQPQTQEPQDGRQDSLSVRHNFGCLV